MCAEGKQILNRTVQAVALALIALAGPAVAGQSSSPPQSFGGITLGENVGAMAEEVFVNGSARREVTITLDRGSFLDCGEGMVTEVTDNTGRVRFRLTCGVTLRETLILPSAGRPAHFTVHY